MKYIRKSLSILLVLTIFMTMAVSSLTVNASATGNSDDYRAWSHHDSRWSGISTLNNGGAPTTAVTKLAIQAGLRDPHDFDIGDMATLLTSNSGYSGSAIVWSAPTKASLNLFSSYAVKQNTGTYTSSSNYSTLINYINQGWHLVIQVTTSTGGTNYVAVDEKLTLASGSTVYIMDCLSNTSNNTNIALAKRYSSYVRVIGYQGEAAQNSSINSDYRKWELNNTNWADTVLNGSSTMNKSKVGGGDLVLASTKLAVQAGLWSDETTGEGNSVNRAVSAISSYASGGVVNDWDDIKTAFGFNSVNNALMGSTSNTTATMSTSLAANVTSITNYLNEGYYLVIRVNSSVGWVAVDTEKTLSTGEIYIMRSTPDASKNADIKLSEYYDTMNRVAGFKTTGVQVTFSGNAAFTASYTKGGNTTSFTSGAYVPDAAVVTVTAAPSAGYTAADTWTVSGGYTFSSHNSTTCTFTTSTSTSTTAAITYTPSPRTYDINYTYGANSASFNYTTIPSAATTGSTVTMDISPKTDGSFVYELKIVARDSDNNEIPVTHNSDTTTYSFTMPASDVTVTFTGQNIEDWRRWARDDERWRDKEMTTNGHTVYTDGAVMIGLTKLAIQAGIKTPTTLTEDNWDINDTVDALQSKITQSNAQLTFSGTGTLLGFSSDNAFLGTSTTSSTRGDIKDGYCSTIVTNLKAGYHQILRIHQNGSSFTTANSDWVVIDEEKTLAAAGRKSDLGETITLSDIYIYRATADANKNANVTLQDFYNDTGGDSNGGYRYVWRNYAYLGGTTPARKINFTIKKDGTALEDTHKGEVAATYTIDGEDTQSFVSGDYAPSRATIKFKYNADAGYYAFDNWTTPDTSVTSLSATETANPQTFTVNPSTFTTSTTANISCNVTPEVYHIYYEDGSNFSYSNNDSTAGYNTSVSFTINPDSGYTVEAANVAFKDADDNTISGLSATKSSRTYTFTMPAKDVYISATATTQTYDDFRAWGVNDSRWSSKSIRTTATAHTMGEAISNGSDAIIAYAKLLIQSGYPSALSTYLGDDVYTPMDSETNEDFMEKMIAKAVTLRQNVNIIGSDGDLNNNSDFSGSGKTGSWAGEWGFATIANNFSIVSDLTTSTFSDGATAGGSRDQAFVYTQLLHGSDSGYTTYKTSSNTYFKGGPYSVSDFTNLIIDYLAGTNSVTISNTSGSGAASRAAATNYDAINNTHNYKFHIMLYVNDTIGWVAVDEARTLNTGDIWVWASHGVVSGNGTSQNNICRLSDLSSTFVRAAGFKFSNTYNLYGTDAAEFTTSNAALSGSYSYLGQTYGPYNSVMYVPHGATVTVTRTSITDHYTPAADKTYGAWASSGSTVTPSSYSETSLVYDTSYQGAASSRHTYDVQYYVNAVPKVHLKFRGDAHGTLYGSRTELSAEAVYYEGDSVVIAPVPDTYYEVDTLTIMKTDSSFTSITSTEAVDPDETLLTFGSDRTGGEESYFIVMATFKGHALTITYNYKEFDPQLAGTHEYKEGASYLVDKSYTTTLDSYAGTEADAVTKVVANAPVLQNVYFNYTCSPSAGNINYNTENATHTASVTMAPTVKNYTVSVNGDEVGHSYHYQEELTLDAEDFDVSTNNLVWTRGAESGKTGSAEVCYDKVYSFRVTSDLNLTVGENLGSRDTVDGTSAVTPGYTEIKMENGVEKCIQNFYIQDFFDDADPTVYDSDGDVIGDAEDVTFLGAGVLFYAYDTSANTPVKSAFGGVEPSRESIYNTLNNNKNAFLSEASGQGKSFKSSNLNYSYVKASSDNGSILRYSTATDSYNYFFSASINNDRTAANQKYVYRVYSFYVCSYSLNGNTYVAPVLSGNYAQAKLYSLAS